jgi:6-phosphogluconolactonase (cycloisomerase 2 family)
MQSKFTKCAEAGSSGEPKQSGVTYLLLIFTAMLSVVSPANVRAAADDELELVQNLAIPELRGITCVALSRDGKFAYTAAGQVSGIAIFKRDSETGQLTLGDVLKDPAVVAPQRVRLSADDQYVTVSDPQVGSVTIFKRDAVNGGLTKAAGVSAGLPGVTDANLSPDDHFLYAATYADLRVFKFEGDTPALIQREKTEDVLKKLRPFVMSPDGHWLYTVAEVSGTIAVFHRNETTGELERAQMLNSVQDAIVGLRGAFRLALSDDGKHLYVSAGRNQGVQAISAFEVQVDGTLILLQQFINGADDFSEFEGGNEISVSPDGKWAFATATLSDRLFRFSRDPATGKLTFITSQQVGTFLAPGAAAVAFSPDSKFVYVGDQGENVIEVYKLH